MATADNLLNTTQNFLTPDCVRKFSSILGQPADKIQIGLRSVIPTFLSALVRKGSSSEGAASLIAIAENDGVENADPSVSLSDPHYLRKGEDAINQIFGNRLISVTDSLSTTTGMNSSVVTKIMSMIAPIVMGSIKRKINHDKLKTDGIMSFLDQQKKVLIGFQTGGQNDIGRKELAGTRAALGPVAHKLRGAIDKSEGHYNSRERVVADYNRPASRPWFWIATSTLLFLTALWWFLNQNLSYLSEEDTVVGQSSPTSSTLITSEGSSVESLDALKSFLRDGSIEELPKRFTFQELNFLADSTALIKGSQNEIDELANALKEFPETIIMIESYNDNLELSNDRALAIKEELKARGIDETRVRAVGKGSNKGMPGSSIEFIITNMR